MCHSITRPRKQSLKTWSPKSAAAWRPLADRPASRFRWDEFGRRFRKFIGR
jgi:hypothetical protein